MPPPAGPASSATRSGCRWTSARRRRSAGSSLQWEGAYGKSFQIQTSPNGTTWTNIYSTTTGTGGTQSLDVTGSGRYVRMNGTARGTGYGYSLWEFGIFTGGTGNPPSSPPPSSPPPSSPPPSGQPVEPTDPANPNFGSNVNVFDPSTPTATIQSRLNTIFNGQETNQFGPERYAVLFKPGSYTADVNMGFFTQVAGLGMSPDDVNINGHVRAEADWDGSGNATQNFWRSRREPLGAPCPAGHDRRAVGGVPGRAVPAHAPQGRRQPDPALERR